jgi:hypothetical protein
VEPRKEEELYLSNGPRLDRSLASVYPRVSAFSIIPARHNGSIYCLPSGGVKETIQQRQAEPKLPDDTISTAGHTVKVSSKPRTMRLTEGHPFSTSTHASDPQKTVPEQKSITSQQAES